MYASAFVQFWEAEVNIRKNGCVCAHPRTGQPMDNPYLKVRAHAEKSLLSMRQARLKTDAIWKRAEAEASDPTRDSGAGQA